MHVSASKLQKRELKSDSLFGVQSNVAARNTLEDAIQKKGKVPKGKKVAAWQQFWKQSVRKNLCGTCGVKNLTRPIYQSTALFE
jgi:hypothetical protein